MEKVIRWGIAGPGRIAHRFAQAMKGVALSEITAVASRDKERAAVFAADYQIQKVYGSYEAMAQDPEVDVIYVAVPHSHHRDLVIDMLNAGKSVLCEKPMAVNQDDFEMMAAAARRNHVFLMEAMWTRFLPMNESVLGWIREGRIGDVREISADFGYRAPFDPRNRAFDPALAGGALLDVGVYPLSFAAMMFDETPEKVTCLMHKVPTGVDGHTHMLIQYAGGQLARLSCAVELNTPGTAVISGTEGWISVPMFWRAEKATIHLADGTQETVEMPFKVNGFEYEIREVCQCLREGVTESSRWTLKDTRNIVHLMDQCRQQNDMKYPFE